MGALALYEGRVLPEWLDANGHMMDGYYAVAFGDASWVVQDHLGMHAEYRERTGATLYTAEAHLVYLRELMLDRPFRVDTLLLGVDAKRIRMFHSLLTPDEDGPAATMELMMLHFNQRTGRVETFPDDVRATLDAVAAEHAGLDWPEQAGRAVRDVKR